MVSSCKLVVHADRGLEAGLRAVGPTVVMPLVDRLGKTNRPVRPPVRPAGYFNCTTSQRQRGSPCNVIS